MDKLDIIEFFNDIYGFRPSNEFIRLFEKFSDYSNSLFPITSFLTDIELIRDERFNKVFAYKDLETIFDTFLVYFNRCLKNDSKIQ